MTVKILYFSWVREKIGLESEEVVLPDGIATPAAVMDWLASRGAGFAEAFAQRSKMRSAVDQVMCALDRPFENPCEIAFFPPVTGG